jgi:transcriptional regulator with XRE-family HTH domain
MIKQLTPARVTPPGSILSEEIEARGWTQKDLAEIMGRSRSPDSIIVISFIAFNVLYFGQNSSNLKTKLSEVARWLP